MTKKFLFIILLCLALAVPSISRTAAAERAMILAFNDSYPPFSFAQNGKIVGMEVDILTEALSKRMKLPIEVKMGPWVRMTGLVKNGEADAFCATPTADRKEFIIPSNAPVISYPIKIYVNKNNPKLEILKGIKNLNDLRSSALAGKFTIGGGIGDAWIKANLEDSGVKIDWADTVQGTILKVANQRVDAYVNNAIVERYLTKLQADKFLDEGNKDGYQKIMDIVELAPVMEVNDFNLCVGKNSPYKSYLNDFDKVMAQMQKDGTVDQIMKKYR